MRKIVLTSIVCVFSWLTTFAVELTELDTTKTDYYVKLGALGSGTSWDDPIGAEAFSYLLEHVKSGAIFRLAAGVYTPVSSSYFVTRAVTIIGGYSESPTKGEASNPSVNKTIFSTDRDGDNLVGDFSANRSDDYSTSFIVNLPSGSKVSVIGCGFEGGKRSQGGPGSAVCQVVGSADFEKCVFSNCVKVFSLDRGSLSFVDCLFENNENIDRWIMGNVRMDGCTFYNNKYISINPAYTVYQNVNDDNVVRYVKVTNCTFKENVGVYFNGKSDSYCDYYNNTFVSKTGTMSFYALNTHLTFVGNIVSVNSITVKDAEEEPHITSKYNAYEILDGEINVPLSDSDILVDGTLQCLSNDLSNEGSYTSYLALSDNKLSDGKSLTFPLSESLVEGDQRRVKRNDPVCMGAYEYKGSGKVVVHRYLGVDTITVLERYKVTGRQYSIGFYSDIQEVFKDENGKDSLIQHHQLFVKPDPEQKVYYVKKSGVGNGTSWDDAMGDTAFAIALFHAKHGVEFRMAEGVYHPVLTAEGKFVDKDVRGAAPVYYTTKHLSFVGGYSNETSDNLQTRNPLHFHTILSGDMNEDDAMQDDCLQDDLEQCFSYKPESSGSTTFDGIEFWANSASKANYGVFNAYNYTTDINRRNNISFLMCTFVSRRQSLHIEYINNVILKNCVIKQYDAVSDKNGFTIYSCGNLTIENSTFSDARLYFSVDKLDMRNNTLINTSENDTNSEPMLSISSKEYKTYDAKLIHNTILGVLKLNSGNIVLSNNIFSKTIENDSYSVLPDISSSNNILMEDVVDSLLKKNILIQNDSNIVLKDRDGFFEILGNDGHKFVLEKNDTVFTPTVVVISDTLSDGRSILVPCSSEVKYDQIGVKRNQYTPAGAREIVGSKSPIVEDVVIDVPNLFTPDGNGLNDIFMEGQEVYVYDLYGHMICHSTNGWDGYFQGELVSSGAYVYVLVMKSGDKKKGVIEVLTSGE